MMLAELVAEALFDGIVDSLIRDQSADDVEGDAALGRHLVDNAVGIMNAVEMMSSKYMMWSVDSALDNVEN